MSCGQKSYKSEQIEQISNDEKKDLEDLERFVEFLGAADWKSVPRGTPYIRMYKMKTTNAGRLSGFSENIPTNAESLAEARETLKHNAC